MFKTRRSVFTATLQLDPVQTAAYLEDQSADNAYLSGLSGGKWVTVDANGYAQLADGLGTANNALIGPVINGALENISGNLHSLANNQITYLGAPGEGETDAVETGVAYVSGDKLYVGTGALAGTLTKTAPTGATAVATVLRGRASGSSDLITILLS